MNQGTPYFQIDSQILREEPKVTRLTLQGRFDAEGLPPVLTELEDARADRCSRFLVDLDAVSFIGSAGIGIFLSLVEEMKNEGGSVVFSRVPESIRKIFDVLNVLEFLEIRDGEDQALDFLLAGEGASNA